MLPKMVTEIAEFSWNRKTQHFETRIYVTDPNTGERELADAFATPPSVWLPSLDAQWEATVAYYTDTTNEKVVAIREKLGLPHQATSGR